MQPEPSDQSRAADLASMFSGRLISLFCVAAIVALVVALGRQIDLEVNWLRPFAKARNIGQKCVSAIAIWNEGDSWDTVRTRAQNFVETPMPYRGTNFDPLIKPIEFLHTKCDVDLTGKQPGDFVWIHLGAIFGRSAIFVNDELLYQGDNLGEVDFPAPSSAIGRSSTIEIISRGLTTNRPGAASLIPMVLIDSPQLLARIRYSLNSWVTDQPFFRFGIAIAISAMLAILWWLGVSYRDLGAMVLLSVLVTAQAYLDFRLPGTSSTMTVRFLIAGLNLGTMILIAGFVLRFCRVPVPVDLELMGIAAWIGYTALCALVPPDIFFSYRMISLLPSHIGAGLLFCAGMYGIWHLARTEAVTVLRLKRMRLVCWIAMFASLLLATQSILETHWGFDVRPYISIILLLIFSGIMIHDLVLHQRGYFHEKLQRQSIELGARADREMAQVMQLIAHDIRKPLLLLKRLAANGDASNALQSIQEVSNSIALVEGMVADINDASTNARPLSESFSLLKILVPLVEDAKRLSGRNDAIIDIRVQPNLNLIGDPKKIGRVFMNLIQNAVEAVPHGGCRIWIDGSPPYDDYAVIEVGNEGSYIPPEIQAKLFDRFFSYQKSGGSGLGLAAVKQIVANHGGSVWCRSSPSAGTSFFVKLPVYQHREETGNKEVATQNESEGVTWILVEDSIYVAQQWLAAYAKERIVHFVAPEDLMEAWDDLCKKSAQRMVLLTDYYFSHTSKLTWVEMAQQLSARNRAFTAFLVSEVETTEQLPSVFRAKISKEPTSPSDLLRLL